MCLRGGWEGSRGRPTARYFDGEFTPGDSTTVRVWPFAFQVQKTEKIGFVSNRGKIRLSGPPSS